MRVVLSLLMLIGVNGLIGCEANRAESAEPEAAQQPASSEQATVEKVVQDPAEVVARMLEGRFSSAVQAAEDEAYHAVELYHARIWPERTDGIWLYVEQARPGRDPYRRRVYRLKTLSDGRVRSDVYVRVDDDSIAPGAGMETAAGGVPSDLDIRSGCSITLERVEAGVWVGGTDGRSCESTLNGASYAASEVRLEQHRITTWDRGFDDAGKQVWGAVDGPYRFDRIGP